MSHASRRALAALVVLLVLPIADAAAARSPDVVPGRYVVVYDGSVAAPGRETDQRARGLGFSTSLRYRHAVKGFAARLSDRQVQRLEADPDVAAVVPDRRVRATATLAGGDTAPAGVTRMGAASGTTVHGSSSAGVAVIDTGIDLDHPDLTVGEGYNCVTGDATPPDDDNGHGTHVAGSIAARNQGSGLVGVAPGTTVHPVKVLDAAGSGTMSQVVCGIDWVASKAAPSTPGGIAVANMSLGGVGPRVATCDTTTDPEHLAICRATRAGVTFVVAAGNSGWDFDYAPSPDTPAAYPEVLTVSAAADSDGRGGGTGPAPSCRTGEVDDRYASFSNYAATSAGAAHLVAAPGVCIRSTWPGGGEDTISGTSMATPHVAGAAALCLGEVGGTAPCAGMTPAQVIARLRQDAEAATRANPTFGFTGDPLRPVSGRAYGFMTPAPVATGSEPAPAPAPAPAPTQVDAAAARATMISGTLRAGTVASLASVDGDVVRIDSTWGSTRTSAFYAAFTGVPSTLSDLRATFRGSSSRSCNHTLSVLRWSDGAWVSLDSRVLSAATSITSSAATDPARFVSSGGEVRVRVRCTNGSSAFTTSTDSLRLRYQRP